MNTEIFYEYASRVWMILGIILIILEFFIPGIVIGFFGIAGIIVGVLIYFGLSIPLAWQIFLWIVLSTFLIFLLRKPVARIFPSLEKQGYLSEEDDILGQWVEVVQEVHHEDTMGRVKFQGTTWSAKCDSGNIPAGSIAYITGRKNLTLFLSLKKPQD